MKKIALLIFLSGCTQANETTPDPRICEAPPRSIGLGEWGSCLHRQAYQLAKAPGSNAEIAKAVESTCADEVAFQLNQAPPNERPQLLAVINGSTTRIALFRVTQARAGNCTVPN